MFDEREGKWINIFKKYTQVMFWLCIVAAVYMCLVGWAGSLWWTGVDFLDGIICLAGGVFIAFAQLVVNVLIIQFLNNVQVMREKVENMNN